MVNLSFKNHISYLLRFEHSICIYHSLWLKLLFPKWTPVDGEEVFIPLKQLGWVAVLISVKAPGDGDRVAGRGEQSSWVIFDPQPGGNEQVNQK